MSKYIRTESGLEKMSEEQYQEYQASKKSEPTYLENRIKAYGSISEQIEFITENGLDAWKTKVEEIKLQYPKPE